MSGSSEVKEAQFKESSTVTQLFSAVFFGGLALWLFTSNGTKLAYVQRASLEKRLQVSCFILTYVATLSCFFNFFQLTGADDFYIPGSDNYTMDLARPVEWIVTCPLLQLVLVLIGGTRIPEYRRAAMPLLSLFFLICGVGSSVTEGPVRWLFYAAGMVAGVILFYYMAKQISEHSGGSESITSGESEFRTATIIIMVTWLPFPFWYIVSPEGLNLVSNVLIIQVGWMFLNITAKFSVIFYIQRIKDNYCIKLKVNRGLNGNQGGKIMDEMLRAKRGDSVEDGVKPVYNSNTGTEKTAAMNEMQMEGVILETMNALGMSQHNDRFTTLIKKAGIKSLADMEGLKERDALKLQLPFDLVQAVQKRVKVWRLELGDKNEHDLDMGECYYMDQKAKEHHDVVSDYQGMNMTESPRQLQSPRDHASGELDARTMEMLQCMMQKIDRQGAAQQRQMSQLESHIVCGFEEKGTRQNKDIADAANRAAERAIELNSRDSSAKVNELQTQLRSSQSEFASDLMHRLDDMFKRAASNLDNQFGQASSQLSAEAANICRQSVQTFGKDSKDMVFQSIERQAERTKELLSQDFTAKSKSLHAAQMHAQAEITSDMARKLEEAVDRATCKMSVAVAQEINAEIAQGVAKLGTEVGNVCGQAVHKWSKDIVTSTSEVQRATREVQSVGEEIQSISGKFEMAWSELHGSREQVRETSDATMHEIRHIAERSQRSTSEVAIAASRIDETVTGFAQTFKLSVADLEESTNRRMDAMRVTLETGGGGSDRVADQICRHVEGTIGHKIDALRDQGNVHLERMHMTTGKVVDLHRTIETGLDRVLRAVESEHHGPSAESTSHWVGVSPQFQEQSLGAGTGGASMQRLPSADSKAHLGGVSRQFPEQSLGSGTGGCHNSPGSLKDAMNNNLSSQDFGSQQQQQRSNSFMAKDWNGRR